ncbi:MAG TPA: hypothetical protein PKA95_12830 [Thermomicrobiales bacterium]|nr:hypothetical protein [Thermomicrobiales bacterium]
MSSVLNPARSLGRGARAFRLPLVLAVLALLAGCRFGPEPTATPPRSASPTGTLTPAGDVLRIDGVPVRRVVIPSADIGPLYAVAGDTLFLMEGEDWTPIGADRFARRYLVDPADLERVFRGRHRVCGATSPEPDVPMEVSKDGGLHWRHLPLGTNIEPMLFDPNDYDVIYGADCNNLVISTNAGNTWDRLDPLPGYTVIEVRMLGTRLLVLGTNPAGNSALAEVDITDPHAPEIGEVLLIANGNARMDATRELIVVAGAGIVHTSDDGGQNWTQTVATVEEEPEETPPAGATPALVPLTNVLALRIGPASIPRLYAGTPAGLLVSQDQGLTWVRYDEVPADAIVTEIQFGLANADLYVTTDPGVIMVPAP